MISTFTLPNILRLVLLSFLICTVRAASAQYAIFTPLAAEAASGSLYYPLQGSFDEQPGLTDLTGAARTVPGSGDGLGRSVPSFMGRQGYIDFGKDFAAIKIVGLWTAYRSSTRYDGSTPYEDIWWSDTNSNVRGPAGTFTDVDESKFNFGTQAINLDDVTVRWTIDFDFSSSPVTPAHRYLIVQQAAEGTFADGRATEFAIVVAVPK